MGDGLCYDNDVNNGGGADDVVDVDVGTFWR